MSAPNPLPLFLSTLPGLEPLLKEEVADLGYPSAKVVRGGVALDGSWKDVWHLNLMCRGATRVLVRIGTFRAIHLAQLDKRARALPWADFLKPGTPVKGEATCRKSKIYHSGAAAERVEKAARAALGPATNDAPVSLFIRLERDECTISLDSSGELLHKRGFKKAVGKAPLRETQAALFLRACGYTGDEPVLDPMCGSATFIIEAAEIAAGLAPGRGRSFAFEQFARFDGAAWADMVRAAAPSKESFGGPFIGFDQDAGAVEAAAANADRAGVSSQTTFTQQGAHRLTRPDGPPGLVMVNPPYGARIGDISGLRTIYRTLGMRLKTEFSGWRVGLVTSEGTLAKATGLPFLPPGPPVPHGSLKIRLFKTGVL